MTNFFATKKDFKTIKKSNYLDVRLKTSLAFPLLLLKQMAIIHKYLKSLTNYPLTLKIFLDYDSTHLKYS